MTMIVWRTAADNPWLELPKDVILTILPAPGDDGRSCGPGPFSMADQEMVTKQLEVAGYTDIKFKRVDAPLMVGNSLDDAIERHDEIDAALKTELAKYQTPEGIILDSSSWVISAVNPG
ncbi:MAG: hypothetical protein ACKVJQ_08040 [Alphaproteobacteria bacterium]